METKRLFVDMDGTLAVFNTVDTLETLYEEGYFFNLEPHENVLGAIKGLVRDSKAEEIEVFVLSAYLTDSKYALSEKNAWLDKYIPEIDDNHRIFVPCGTSKKEAIDIREDDFLLDDYTKNLLDWQPPARGIKLVNGINDSHKTWRDSRVWFTEDPDQIAGDILYLMKDKVYDRQMGRKSLFNRVSKFEHESQEECLSSTYKEKKF